MLTTGGAFDRFFLAVDGVRRGADPRLLKMGHQGGADKPRPTRRGRMEERRTHHTNPFPDYCTACGLSTGSSIILCGKSLIVCLSPVWLAMFINESNSSAVVFLALGCRRRNVTGELEAVSASAASVWPHSCLSQLRRVSDRLAMSLLTRRPVQ